MAPSVSAHGVTGPQPLPGLRSQWLQCRPDWRHWRQRQLSTTDITSPFAGPKVAAILFATGVIYGYEFLAGGALNWLKPNEYDAAPNQLEPLLGFSCTYVD